MNSRRNQFYRIWNFVLIACALLLTCSPDESSNGTNSRLHKSSSPSYQTSFLIDSTRVSVNIVQEGLRDPWEISWGPDDHLWITEHNMKVARINPNNFQLKPVRLDDIKAYSDTNYNSPLGLAHHPDFVEEPYVYISFLEILPKEKTGYLSLKRYRYDKQTESLANPITFVEGIHIDHNMNPGGRLIITSDHKLIMSTSQETPGSMSIDGHPDPAQDTFALLGKILRFNLDGSIPTDNPVAGCYTWSLGHRNPQGLALGQEGKLYASEHGPSDGDEINWIRPGRNYGWPLISGIAESSQTKEWQSILYAADPLKSWTPTIAPSSLGYYGHFAIREWKNCLLVTTLKEGDLRVLQLDSRGDKIISEKIYLDNQFGRLRDLATAPDGRVFVTTLNILIDSIGQVPPVGKDQNLTYDLIIELKAEEK